MLSRFWGLLRKHEQSSKKSIGTNLVYKYFSNLEGLIRFFLQSFSNSNCTKMSISLLFGFSGILSVPCSIMILWYFKVANKSLASVCTCCQAKPISSNSMESPIDKCFQMASLMLFGAKIFNCCLWCSHQDITKSPMAVHWKADFVKLTRRIFCENISIGVNGSFE